MSAISSGRLDDVLVELQDEIKARMAHPEFKGRRPVAAVAERGPSMHCRGRGSHPGHYFNNTQSRYADLIWCPGTA